MATRPIGAILSIALHSRALRRMTKTTRDIPRVETGGLGPRSRLIVREREPLNLEFPFDQLDGRLTPNDLFFVRSHFPAPRLDLREYRLNIEGAVRQSYRLGLPELMAMPAVTRPATLECAGNGRIFLAPKAKGVQWQLGAVGTADWTGVPLPALLERAGVEADASEIVLEGADRGTPNEDPMPPGETQYARSIPMSKAADVLIAYAMNGEALTVDHGYPVRAVVRGHYGMASVKWLTHIRAATESFQGYWQTTDYAYWNCEHGNPVRRPLGAMALKSSIARPRTGETLRAGSSCRIFGAAWSGGTPVVQVELSTDAGRTWRSARFLDDAQQFLWRRWEFDWKVPEEKRVYVLKSRATDAEGNVQPEEHDKRFGAYVIHHTLGIEVAVS